MEGFMYLKSLHTECSEPLSCPTSANMMSRGARAPTLDERLESGLPGLVVIHQSPSVTLTWRSLTPNVIRSSCLGRRAPRL